MDLISWENISFENIREGDLIRSSTSPASQLNLEDERADRKIEGIIISKGNSPEDTVIEGKMIYRLTDSRLLLENPDEIVRVPLAYDLGGSAFTFFEKRTINFRGLNQRETGTKRKFNQPQGQNKRASYFSLKENNKDISYLLK